MLKVVADTNTLVSAAIAKGNEFELLRQARRGRVQMVTSPQLLAELRGVLSRPKFWFSTSQVEAVVTQVADLAAIVVPSAVVDAIRDDPADNRVLECALAGRAQYIVSGDKHLLNLGAFKGIKIVRTSDFLRLLRSISGAGG